jgi:hypothetical protein
LLSAAVLARKDDRQLGGIISPLPSFAFSYLRDDDNSRNINRGPIINAFTLHIIVHCNCQTHAHHLGVVNNMRFNVGRALIDLT